MRKENNYILPLALIFLVFFGVGFYIYKAQRFEREAPKIFIKGPVYWNFKSPLRIVMADNVGVKSYKVTIEEPTRRMVVADVELNQTAKLLDLNLTYPKTGFVPTSDKATIKIEARDGSDWNFFRGNKTVFESAIIADNIPPKVEVIANSASISRGGSALVIFEAEDVNLEKVFVATNDDRVFQAQPFVKKGFYAALVAWNIKSENLSLEAVAVDKAQNITKVPIQIAAKNIIYKDSNLELKDDFLDGKILELSSTMPNIATAQKIDRFVYVNQTMRGENEALVRKITSRVGTDS